MDKIYSKVLENDFDVSYDEFIQYLRLIFKLMTARGRYVIFDQSKSEFKIENPVHHLSAKNKDPLKFLIVGS